MDIQTAFVNRNNYFDILYSIMKRPQPDSRIEKALQDYDDGKALESLKEMKTYKILRYRFQGETELIDEGLTLKEAQAHCSRADTRGEGWFDGYTEE